ncbi:MAG TPA: hypothetical protein VJX67_18650 [Blastocatellia bacterium]|nr:hypothetical protein [Blastocatellia bacterium]
MPRTCTVCRHPQREAIEKECLAGAPYRAVAVKYGTSHSTLQRHEPHMRRELVQVHEAVEVARSERLLDCVRAGEARAERMCANAEEILAESLRQGDMKMALLAIRTSAVASGELREYQRFRGELSGELGKAKAPFVPEARIVITREPALATPLSPPPLLPTGVINH